MVTMRDVARAAGVSQAAVSYAFSNSPKVSDQQRQRIYAIAAELGFTGPNVVGRSLRSGRIGAVGVMVVDSLVHAVDDPSTTLLMKGIVEVGELAHVALTLLSVARPGDRGTEVSANPALRGLVDGVVLHNVPGDHPAVEALLAQAVPMVAIDSPVRPDIPLVTVDNVRAGRLQMQHVLDRGHRRIGIVTDRLRPVARGGLVTLATVEDATEVVVRDRLRGHLEACRQADVPPSDLTVVETTGIDRLHGLEAAEVLLARSDPTAIVATSDVHAAAAWEVLRRRGARVPEDVSIIGFDDAPVADLLDLTTMRQPLVDKGRTAARVLLDRLEGTDRRHQLLDVVPIIRSSTAGART
ncbi:LacI family DNA-binding transcriptional regulator [Pseudonocardia halophobica]|uniref:LacI family DNA-binding transcriptional regulator n=1 Tax=Pseudonocardia halophobica TaxID=29401 RepID=UPI003D91AA0B